MDQTKTRMRFKKDGAVYRVVSIVDGFVTYRRPYDKEPRNFGHVNMNFVELF